VSPQPVPPHLFIVFGATGDLARRKLLPAVSRLARSGALQRGQHVLAVARDDSHDDASYRAWAREVLAEAGERDLGHWCDACLHYQPFDVGGADHAALRERIEDLEREHDLPGNRLFYLAVPPRVFARVIDGLGRAGLHESAGFTRIVVEKPFGEDLASARALNGRIHEWFDESQVFRIDHFLGKETIQNLVVFRFANAIVEALWRRELIDNVQITVAEDVGVGGRAGYFDGVGTLRDMIQNHLTQLLGLVAMEVPVAYDAASVRHEKLKVLRAVRPIDPGRVVFGRYTAGSVAGRHVPGYQEEDGVPDDSRTETFVALRLDVDTWRWQGVPFYLRTGKRMDRRRSEVVVTFRRPPVHLFEGLDGGRDLVPPEDVLRIRLQPDEGFSLALDVKRPGEPPELQKVPLEFHYGETFGELPDAYVTLLLDALEGDQTHFVHADEVEASWALYEPLLDGSLRLHDYTAGTVGPDEAERLLERDGRAWRALS